MKSIHKVLLQCSEKWALKKSTSYAIELWAELDACFVLGNHSYLKESLSVNGYSDRYLADVFSQKNKVNLSCPGKQLTKFIANAKIWSFKWKSFEKLVSATLKLTAC